MYNSIKIISSAIGNWKDVLREYIDEDQLPVAYGGSLTDPDGNPLCKTKVSSSGISIQAARRSVLIFPFIQGND